MKNRPTLQVSASSIIPNLITVGNAVCGFVALTLIAGVSVDPEGHPVHIEYFKFAAWVILLGMIFDVFDGRIARLMGGESELGAHLDSLCDLVTFGLAPAALMVKLHQVTMLEMGETQPWTKLIWALGLAYFLGAMLRLARFNVEHGLEDEDHVCFAGLPTPAAAGTVASLVLVKFWFEQWQEPELLSFAATAPEWTVHVGRGLVWFLPAVTAILGFAMVYTQFQYPHMGTRLLRKQSFHSFVSLIFAVLLTCIMPEPILCLLFFGYMAATPLRTLFHRTGESASAEPSS